MPATGARNTDTNVRNVESKEEASKQTTVMPEALTERGLLEQVYGLQGRLYEQANVDGVRHEIRVSKLDLMEVFKAQHSQVRAEEQARGAWIMGRRLRTQVMQIWSLKVKKVGIKRLEFFKIGSLASLIGRPDERILEHE